MTRLGSGMRRLNRGEDGGFGLIEAVVSVVILGIVAMVAARLVIGTLGVTKRNAQRTAAADIAATQIESVQRKLATDIAPERVQLPDVSQGGTTYSVVQEGSYVTADSPGSGCAGSGPIAYMRVAVVVTWPNMGSTAPVRTETLRALSYNAVDSTKGAESVQVIDGVGKPVPGVDVTLRQSSSTGFVVNTLTTDSDGCAVFVNLAAGTNYYASGAKTGFVSMLGQPVAQDTGAGITANAITRSQLVMGQASQATYTLVPPAGATMPTDLTGYPVNLTAGIWPAGSTDRQLLACGAGLCVSGTTIKNMFPTSYGAWAGKCPDSRETSTLVDVTPDANNAFQLPLAGAKVSTTNSALVGKTLYAVHQPYNGACTSVIRVGTVPGVGQTATYALPQGSWSLATITTPATATAVSLTVGSITDVAVTQ